MKFSDLLRSSHIRLDLPPADKFQTISSLAQCLQGGDAIIDFDTLLQEILDREQLNTTGIGQCVAIPHARTEAVSDFAVAIGVCREGLDFGSLDHQPVRLIILLGIPAGKVKEYLKFLAELSKMLQQPGFVDAVIACKNPDTLVALFSKI
ncbi:MAG: PTS sugar transporter subunit IIA [Sedimentisphaerales bacterium]|nr:PTS sugar transporter subunit IIA [Sedimentisphaerales bacterium]